MPTTYQECTQGKQSEVLAAKTDLAESETFRIPRAGGGPQPGGQAGS